MELWIGYCDSNVDDANKNWIGCCDSNVDDANKNTLFLWLVRLQIKLLVLFVIACRKKETR